jgi:addiction module RelE/StbE family toxin
MRIVFDKDFFKKLKKVNVRIRKSFKANILLFSENPHNPKLNNHLLKKEWEGYRSIDITADWRAIYKELQEGGEVVAYFIALGTHKDLYERTG